MNNEPIAIDSAGLGALETRVAHDLEILGYPPNSWVKQHRTQGMSEMGEAGGAPEQPMLDVLVIGAGMCGLAAGFALLRRGVRGVLIVDRADAGREGPWVTYARMRTLRSPKHLTGPAAGLPSISFRAWYEAQYGASGWDALGRIPRTVWMEYLRWYRRVLDLPVHNQVTVTGLEPLDLTSSGAGFAVQLRSEGTSAAELPPTVHARRVVIATGREGMAVPRIPPPFASVMGRRCWHSSELIDFGTLRDRTVAVVGWAASAVDNAATALEAGASAVHMVARAPRVPRINKAKSLVYSGFTEGYPALNDQDRFDLLRYVTACGVAAPRDSVLRIAHDPRLHLHFGADTREVRDQGGQLQLCCDHEAITTDAVILGTGFRIDLETSPLLGGAAAAISRWQDRAALAHIDPAEELLQFPYLGGSFEFIEREAGAAPWLQDLYCFNHAAWLSHGYVSSDIPAVSEGADRLARGLIGSLFMDDVAAHISDLHAYVEPELLGDELDLGPEHWWPAVATREAVGDG